MSENTPHEPKPFLAPCRELSTFAAFKWIRRGYQDFKKVIGISLFYGIVMTCISLFITVVAYQAHSLILAIALIAGFFFLEPLIAIGL